MIVDFHQHAYPGVHELMDQSHITMCNLLPGPGKNETVLAWAKKWPDRFIPWYWVDLEEDPQRSADALSEAVNRGHRGIKFQPLVQRFYPNEHRLRPIFARAQELGIPVLFHSGIVAFDNHYAQYGTCVYIDELAGEFGDLTIVIAHMGGNFHYEALVIAEKNPNVHLDTAYLHFFCARMLPKIEPMDLIRRAVEFAGPTKVLYGYEGYSPREIMDSHLPNATKKLILWQNAKRILDLPEPDWQGNHI